MQKKIVIILFTLLSIPYFSNCAVTTNVTERPNWQLGVQAFSFHKFTFAEAVEKVSQLDLNYIEAYFGQPLGDGFKGIFDMNMEADTRQKLLDFVKSKAVKIVACGVIICETEAEWRKLFDFASKMGIAVITCEPEAGHLDMVEKLADQYNIDVAIHNHPKPSLYWQPEMVLKALEGRGKHMGACADVGHWKRMGIDPLEGLKKYRGRLKSVHFKDIEKDDPNARDTIWGDGVCNVGEMLAELKVQHFSGVMSIEYEYNWENSLPDIQKCIGYYHQVVKKCL
jgi:sugar phosphate isomerase/epimerase